MSFLEEVIQIFKKSALYNSYSDNQREAVDKILEIHNLSDKQGYLEKEDHILLDQLERKVTRRVLSASIPVMSYFWYSYW